MNKDVLSREMANAGISVSEMCKILGISRKSFWEKRSGKTEFKLSEVSAIMKALHRDDPRPIFFDKLVSDNEISKETSQQEDAFSRT